MAGYQLSPVLAKPSRREKKWRGCEIAKCIGEAAVTSVAGRAQSREWFTASRRSLKQKVVASDIDRSRIADRLPVNHDLRISDLLRNQKYTQALDACQAQKGADALALGTG